MDSTEDAEWAEEDENFFNAFDEVGGVRDCLYISKTGFGFLMEAMITVHCEEAHRRTIKKLEVYGEISNK